MRADTRPRALPPPIESSPVRGPVALAIVAALAVRALVWFRVPAPPSWDGALYATLAQGLRDGVGFVHWFSPPGAPRPTAFYPVGYPAFLALGSLLTGSIRAAIPLVNLAAAAVAAGCAAALGGRIAGRRGAYAAGMIYALAPGPALWSAASMTETLHGALIAAAVLVAAASEETPKHTRWLRGFGAGTLVGLGALVRPQLVLVAPFVGGLPPARRRALRVITAVACVIGAAVVIAPWTVRNCRTLGTCTLVSTNGGSNLLIGTFPEVRGGYREPGPDDGCADVRGEGPRDRCMTRRAIERIEAEPLVWARLAVLKVVRTFAYEWAPVSYLRSAIPGVFAGETSQRVAAFCTLSWWAVLVAALVGGRRAVRLGGAPRALARITLLHFVLFALTHAVFIGDDRYHLPLWPLLSALAGGAALPPRASAAPALSLPEPA